MTRHVDQIRARTPACEPKNLEGWSPDVVPDIQSSAQGSNDCEFSERLNVSSPARADPGEKENEDIASPPLDLNLATSPAVPVPRRRELTPIRSDSPGERDDDSVELNQPNSFLSFKRFF
ncbi:unnamed protein product, partial [Iphiclides podalirius]